MPDRLLRPTAVLLDLDGVLYVEDERIPGATEAVAALRDRGLGLRFVTNTTSRPRRDILARLERLGMPVPERELMTPARLAVEHCLAAGRQARPADAVMVGDDVESDVGGALRAGLAGVLVRTGKYRPEAVAASGVEPTATVDSIVNVPTLLGT